MPRFLAIAGAYTAIAGLALPPRSAIPVLAVVVVRRACRRDAALLNGHTTRWLAVGPYLVLGWAAVAAVPQLFDRLGVAGFGLLAFGAALYTLGATVCAGQRPDRGRQSSVITMSFTCWSSPPRPRTMAPSTASSSRGCRDAMLISGGGALYTRLQLSRSLLYAAVRWSG